MAVKGSASHANDAYSRNSVDKANSVNLGGVLPQWVGTELLVVTAV